VRKSYLLGKIIARWGLELGISGVGEISTALQKMPAALKQAKVKVGNLIRNTRRKASQIAAHGLHDAGQQLLNAARKFARKIRQGRIFGCLCGPGTVIALVMAQAIGLNAIMTTAPQTAANPGGETAGGTANTANLFTGSSIGSGGATPGIRSRRSDKRVAIDAGQVGAGAAAFGAADLLVSSGSSLCVKLTSSKLPQSIDVPITNKAGVVEMVSFGKKKLPSGRVKYMSRDGKMILEYHNSEALVMKNSKTGQVKGHVTIADDQGKLMAVSKTDAVALGPKDPGGDLYTIQQAKSGLGNGVNKFEAEIKPGQTEPSFAQKNVPDSVRAQARKIQADINMRQDLVDGKTVPVEGRGTFKLDDDGTIINTDADGLQRSYRHSNVDQNYKLSTKQSGTPQSPAKSTIGPAEADLPPAVVQASAEKSIRHAMSQNTGNVALPSGPLTARELGGVMHRVLREGGWTRAAKPNLQKGIAVYTRDVGNSREVFRVRGPTAKNSGAFEINVERFRGSHAEMSDMVEGLNNNWDYAGNAAGCDARCAQFRSRHMKNDSAPKHRVSNVHVEHPGGSLSQQALDAERSVIANLGI
jgi:hypothetical protein